MTLLYVLNITSLVLNFALIGVLFYFYLKSLKKHEEERLKWQEEQKYYIKKFISYFDDEHEEFTMIKDKEN